MLKINRLTIVWEAAKKRSGVKALTGLNLKGALLGMLFCFLVIIVLASIQQPSDQTKNTGEQVSAVNKSDDAYDTTRKAGIGNDNSLVVEKQQASAGISKVLPLPSGPLKQEFGWQYNAVLKDWRYHTGIDIGKKVNAKVLALKAGQVTEIYNDEITGLTVRVKCGTDEIYYGSLAQVLVNQGDSISAGKVVGMAGKSKAEDFVHIHLAVRQNGNLTDPCQVFATGGAGE